MMRWTLLVVITVAVTVPLTIVGVPSAALFAALIVGIVLALLSFAPAGVPRKAGIAAQGVLGVYIGTMVHHDALTALGVGLADRARGRRRHAGAEHRRGRAAGSAPRHQPAHRRAGAGRGRRVRPGRDRPRTRRRRSRGGRRAVPAGRADHRVDAGRRHPRLPRREDRTRAPRPPKPVRRLGISASG